MHRRALPLLAAFAAALSPCAAAAWSEPGHRMVAAIAEARLSPAARRLVREIVGDTPLSAHEIAAWADDHRDDRTGPWHYVNVPLAAPGYDAARDCPRAGCVVSAIEAATATLRDGTDAVALADSLRYLVHFVGDVHQPLHAVEARDRGGNLTEVRLGRRKQPLSVHRLWDHEVLAPLLRRSDPLRAARSLDAAIRPADAAAWAADLSPASWATASHLEARAIYQELATFPVGGRYALLPGDYAERHEAETAGALARAGVRLAALLDRIAAAREARRGR